MLKNNHQKVFDVLATILQSIFYSINSIMYHYIYKIRGTSTDMM